jgi:hypothetical protein
VISLAVILFLLLTWLGGAYFYVRGISTDLDAILEITMEGEWSADTIRAAAGSLSVSPTTPAWLWLVLESVMVITVGSLGMLLFWRKVDWFGTYLGVAFVLIATRITGPISFALTIAFPELNWLLGLLSILAVLAFFSIGYIFPDGRFIPPWSRWFALIVLIFTIFWSLFQSELIGQSATIFDAIFFLGFMGLGIAAQVYRYIRVSGPVERQQTKWVLASLILFLFVTLAAWFLFPSVFTTTGTLTSADLAAWGVFYTLLIIVMMLFIGAITIAVLRYRLWDIDILIRRTLVYGTLTTILALVYFGSVVVLQSLFAAVTEQQSPVAIVISTLVIAALFQPLRQRIQALIDRRFFRRKYDASQALAQFGQTARDEVDLEQLTAALLQVTRDTMQPERVLLWLPQSFDEE